MPVETRSQPNTSADEGFAHVHALLDQGETKAALAIAKDLHKTRGTPQSEVLLVIAYTRRIEDLTARGLTLEASQLETLVRTRFPRTAPARLAPKPDPLDELVRPLADPDLAPAERARIESTLRRTLADPAALARSTALPEQHPLRVGALALAEAFAAVTTGPVSTDALSLPTISHRGPLAPWKSLVRAIACFYRREDAACERFLDAIDAESRPARLAAPLRAMLGRAGAPAGGAAASDLVRRIARSGAALAPALAALDSAEARGTPAALYKAVRHAVDAMRRLRPDRLEAFKQTVAIRFSDPELSVKRLIEAMGGPSLKDAAYFRLSARRAEIQGTPLLANLMWDQFRKQAIRQRWFAADGLEVAALFVRMATNLKASRGVPPGELSHFLATAKQQLEIRYSGQAPEIRAVAWDGPDGALDDMFYSPGRLFERACQLDPDPTTYRSWMDWEASSGGRAPAADRVAEAWHRAFPQDSEPLLALMRSAEARGALQKALKYLQAAEELSRVDPAVRLARMRLLLSTALRHLTQRKPRLLAGDLDRLEALPQMRDGDRPGVLMALRHASLVIERREAEAAALFADLVARTGSELTAVMVLHSIGQVCRIELPPASSQSPRGTEGSRLHAAARACAILADAGVAQSFPAGWPERLAEECRQDRGSLDPLDLVFLGRAALEARLDELAHAAAGAGLRRDGEHAARFLLVRAKSLMVQAPATARRCLLAAAALARRSHEPALVDEIVDLLHAGPGSSAGSERMHSELAMSPEETQEVIQKERASLPFPAREQRALPAPGQYWCDGCRAFHDDGEDEYDDDDPFGDELESEDGALDGAIPAGLDDDLLEAMFVQALGLPPRVASLVVELYRKCGYSLSGAPPTQAQMDRMGRQQPELFARIEQEIARSLRAGEMAPPRGATPPAGTRKRRRS